MGWFNIEMITYLPSLYSSGKSASVISIICGFVTETEIGNNLLF